MIRNLLLRLVFLSALVAVGGLVIFAGNALAKGDREIRYVGGGRSVCSGSGCDRFNAEERGRQEDREQRKQERDEEREQRQRDREAEREEREADRESESD